MKKIRIGKKEIIAEVEGKITKFYKWIKKTIKKTKGTAAKK